VLATALIVFREVLEAALIISIVMAAARGAPRRSLWITAGVATGVLAAGGVAGFADVIAGAVSGMGQEVFNATVLFSAVLMLGWHNIWMKRHGRELAAQMNGVGRRVIAGEQPLYALAIVVGLAVLREGSEVVLFLYGIAATSDGGKAAMLTGGLLGIGAGAGVGWGMYLGLLRIPTRHLFAVTSWMILLLAAGMSAQGAAYLVQAGMLPPLGGTLWDTSWLLSEHSVPGQVLHALVGYVARPEGVQVVFYLLTAITIGGLMKLVDRQVAAAAALRKAGVTTLIAPVALLTGLLTVIPDAHATHKVYSPLVEKGEMEIEARGHVDVDANGDKDGAREDIYEVGYGITDWWSSSLFVEFAEEPHEGYRHEATAWENIFQLTDTGRYWLDAGLYLEYEWAADSDSPNKVEGKLLLEKSKGRWVNTANLIVEREVGSGASDDVELGYAWRTKYRLRPELEPAVELYGGFGDLNDVGLSDEDRQQAGPVLTGKFRAGNRGAFVYEAGYLFGLTDASPDGTVKWLLEYEYAL